MFFTGSMYEGLPKKKSREHDDQLNVPLPSAKKRAIKEIAEKHDAKLTDFIRYLIDREIERNKQTA